MDKTGGNRTHAAKLLGISVRTLRNKLNEYGVHSKYADAQESEQPELPIESS
jgi:DNA-binding NtrC family response regulator